MSRVPHGRLAQAGDEIARLLKLLGHPARFRIVCELAIDERNVGDLVEKVGLRQSALSQHLARMREDGLVAPRRDAQHVYYSIADQRARQLLPHLADIFLD